MGENEHLNNSSLNPKARASAKTDEVTGLYNPRHFIERLAESCEKYETAQKPFSLLLINMDHFKEYNDTLGYAEGDKLLRESVMLINSYCRESDLVCRYGADEFAVILYNWNKNNAARHAGRLREAFYFRFRIYKVKITASIGMASFPEDALTKEDLLSAAEMALAKSKKSGGDEFNCAPSRRDDPPPMDSHPRKDPPPDDPYPSNVPPSRCPPALSSGNAREIPRDSGTQQSDDPEK
ncbi:MAG: GGDEF domain-containing protein [Candidatus Eremiobacteraeota bacterium]|nr:GGDEF domain-containing protein [Candidatus Eremiobacteraeota bacterium]